MQWYINSEKLYYTHKNPIKDNAIDRSLLYAIDHLVKSAFEVISD